jgi:apolipoprotein D and lipocalin family protein
LIRPFKFRRHAGVRLAAFAFAFSLLGCTEHPPLEVAKVELGRFQGGWYEAAKLPRVAQAGCVGTIARYRLVSETELDVYTECREGSFDGPVRRMAARAVVTDPEEPAKLSLDFGGYFGDYWIVERTDDYRYAAVGHPSRDYLWFLSRTPVLGEDDFSALSESMDHKGFEVARLERTAQDAEGPTFSASDQAMPVPTDHGCSFASTSAPSPWGLSSMVLLMLGLVPRWGRRR